MDDLFGATGQTLITDDDVNKKRNGRIRKLLSQVKKAKTAYYNKQPIMLDIEYDVMEDELRKLLIERGDDPDVVIPIGAPVEDDDPDDDSSDNNKFDKAYHSIPMGSQSKCADEKEFSKWWRLHNPKNKVMVATNKLDGASLALYYEDGDLVQAITRGNGKIGRDITPNARRFAGVPAKISATGSVAIRGECILSVENWKKLDPKEETNPRNLGTGIMSREDGKNCDKLNFISFDISDSDTAFTHEIERLKRLRKLGFGVTFYKKCETYKDIIDFYEGAKSLRKDNAVNMNGQHYWIDGLVLKINSIAIQEEMGESSGRPKWSTALKFPSPGAITILEDVEYSVGYTGTITPVGIITPVEIAGTTVRRVTLNNWDSIKEKDVALNDRVRVIKAGDIIPKLVDVLERPAIGRVNRIKLEPPRACPVCNAKAEKTKNADGSDGVVIQCTNPFCKAKIIGKFKRLVGKLDILEIGESIIVGMNKAGILVNLADLFRLAERREEIAKLEVGNGVWGKSRTDKMIDEVDAKKEMTLDVFLGMMGIPSLGQRKAKMVMEKANGTMDTIADWRSGTILKNAASLGVPTTASKIHLSIQSMSGDIDALLEVITITSNQKKVSGPLNGMSFVLTGTMSKGRKEITKDIEGIGGGEMHKSVSKTTTYLVQADPDAETTKSKKANKLGVKVIGEEELMEMING